MLHRANELKYNRETLQLLNRLYTQLVTDIDSLIGIDIQESQIRSVLEKLDRRYYPSLIMLSDSNTIEKYKQVKMMIYLSTTVNRYTAAADSLLYYWNQIDLTLLNSNKDSLPLNVGRWQYLYSQINKFKSLGQLDMFGVAENSYYRSYPTEYPQDLTSISKYKTRTREILDNIRQEAARINENLFRFNDIIVSRQFHNIAQQYTLFFANIFDSRNRLKTYIYDKKSHVSLALSTAVRDFGKELSSWNRVRLSK